MRRLSRLAFHVAIVIDGCLAISIVRDVANVTTTRLYLAARSDAAPHSDAAERFDIEGSRVVPQIAVRRSERIAFDTAAPWPSTLHLTVRPSGSSPFEIIWSDRGSRQYAAQGFSPANASHTLARGASAEATTIKAALPSGPGSVELVAHAPLTWVDPRMVSDLRVAGRALLFLLFGA